MTEKFIPELESAFESFKQHLEDAFNARITNEDQLRGIFLGEIGSLISVALDGDAESGSCVDELYGDDILGCIEVPEEDEDETLMEDDLA